MPEDLYCAVPIKMFVSFEANPASWWNIVQVRACQVRHPAVGRARWLLWYPCCCQVTPLFLSNIFISVSSSSIPNPLFDLAGITCGHFLVPFWTFFGATLIGKAVIKMHIQVGISIDRVVTLVSFSENLRYLGFQQRALWGRSVAPCANSCPR